MKKILLSLACVAIAFTGFGQYKQINKTLVERQEIDNSHRIANPVKQVIKKKKRGTRTYTYIDAVDQNEFGGSGLAFQNSSAMPIWQDSTILQRFSTGYGAINYSSCGAAINPKSYFYNSSWYNGEMHIDNNQPYTIDSIYLTGIYMHPGNKGAVAGDKIRISVVLSDPDDMSFWQYNGSAGTVKADYLDPVGTTDTVIRGAAPDADSVGRIGGYPGGARITWDYNLTNADTSSETPTQSYFYKRFGFAPPSPINVAAGEIAAVSFTFISGDTWIANQDSVSFNNGSKAHFRARFFEESAGALMPYRNHSDRTDANNNTVGAEWNNSCLMFSFAPDIYYPSILVEAFNTPAMSREHLDVDWVLSCTNCGPVSTEDVVKELDNVKIYPNPASDVLNIQLDEVKTADVNVSVYSMTGKKLYSETVAKGSTQTSVNIGDLAVGIYLCELEMNGEKSTVKITKK